MKMPEDEQCVMCAQVQSKHVNGIYCPDGERVFGYKVAGLFSHPFMGDKS